MRKYIRSFLRRADTKAGGEDTQENGKNSRDFSVNNVTKKQTARDRGISGSVTEISYVLWEIKKPIVAADTESPAPGDTESPGTRGDTESPGTPGNTAKLSTAEHIALHITKDSVTLNTAEDTETLGSIEFKQTPGKSALSAPLGTQADTNKSGPTGDTDDTGVSGPAGTTRTLEADTVGHSTGSFTERSLERSLSHSASRTNPDLHETQPSGFSRRFVTIWSWNDESSVSWLSDYLNMYSSIKGLQLEDCKYVCLKGDQKSQDQAIDSPLCIIVYCDCSEELQNYMERFLDSGKTENGSQSFLVIIGGFTDETSMNQMREDWEKGPYSSCKLLLFTKKDIEFLKQLLKNNAESWISMNEKLQQITEIISKESKSNMTKDASSQNATKDQETGSSSTVGIFSRSAESDYEWLQVLLRSERFSDQIQVVRSFYISNNKMAEFINDVQQCKFGILYHTMNRGRINITNVRDSLYDDELELMSGYLGRDNVLVVADDLEDSSDQEKQRILESQPKIRNFATDLLLVAETEKKDETCLLKKLKSLKLFKSENDTMTTAL